VALTDWSDLIGSAVGVVGAVWVAKWTTDRQIRADRQIARTEKVDQAASKLIRLLLDVEPLTHQLEKWDWMAEPQENLGAFRQLRDVRLPLERELVEHGSLLPAALEAQLMSLLSRIGGLVSVDWDEDSGFAINVDIATHTECRIVRDQTHIAIEHLRALRVASDDRCRCAICRGDEMCCHGRLQQPETTRH
jgi:hypothetical protein